MSGLVISVMAVIGFGRIQAQETVYPRVDTQIVLEGNTITVDGEGAEVENNVVTVVSAGTYSLSGVLDDGQLVVDTDDEDVVNLILNGVTMHSDTSAPLYIKEAGSAVIYLVESTENILSDAAVYVYEDPEDDEPNAALFSDDALTIDGGGTLTVSAHFNDGITSKDTLTLLNAVLNVSAPDDGIRGKDSLTIDGATITVDAQGDGLKADNEDDDLGIILIESGMFDIQAGGDAMQAVTTLTINGGDFNVTTGEGSLAPIGGDDSAKGLKADVRVNVNGGTLTLDTADDGIHANDAVRIDGGVISISSGDDAIHADRAVEINGGVISVVQSYEGIEATVIAINGGEIRIVSSDDGVNVAGGNDGSGGPGGRAPANPDYILYITGGHLVIDAEGDGIDSNGSIEITDGVVIVNGTTRTMNAPVDYDGHFIMTGGLLIGVGSSAMAQAPDRASTQNSLLINFTSVYEPGTMIHIENSAGESILTFEPAKTYNSLVFSSPELESWAAYTVYVGGSSDGTAVDGLYESGTYTPGAPYTDLTISETVTLHGEMGRRGRRGN